MINRELNALRHTAASRPIGTRGWGIIICMSIGHARLTSSGRWYWGSAPQFSLRRARAWIELR